MAALNIAASLQGGGSKKGEQPPRRGRRRRGQSNSARHWERKRRIASKINRRPLELIDERDHVNRELAVADDDFGLTRRPANHIRTAEAECTQVLDEEAPDLILPISFGDDESGYDDTCLDELIRAAPELPSEDDEGFEKSPWYSGDWR